jgi:threonine/homoserine/homoserine lactone efflux protein
MRAVDSTPHSLIEGSLKRGIILNLLNPHPYIFWISVGGPMVGKAMRLGISWAILFVLGFYIMLVGSKVVVAIMVETTRTFLGSRAYLYTMKALGIILVIFAYFFMKEGLFLLRGGEGGLGPS